MSGIFQQMQRQNQKTLELHAKIIASLLLSFPAIRPKDEKNL
jgi:hypothetical protein